MTEAIASWPSRSLVAKARLQPRDGETLAVSMKRVLVAEIVSARRVLEDRELPRDRAVHDARRHMKWIRSLWFVLDPVPGANREGRRRQVAETAALLSRARDADVMASEAHKIFDRSGVGEAGRRLVENLEADARLAHRETPPVEAVLARLRASEADARSLPTHFEAGRHLAEALAACYRRGRRDWRALLDGGSAEALHDWRKRVKRRHHITALVPVPTAVTTRSIQTDLDDLGEILGEEHDLSLLAGRLVGGADAMASKEREALIDRIADRRRKLEKAALVLGEELYGAKTRMFVEELAPIVDL